MNEATQLTSTFTLMVLLEESQPKEGQNQVKLSLIEIGKTPRHNAPSLAALLADVKASKPTLGPNHSCKGCTTLSVRLAAVTQVEC